MTDRNSGKEPASGPKVQGEVGPKRGGPNRRKRGVEAQQWGTSERMRENSNPFG